MHARSVHPRKWRPLFVLFLLLAAAPAAAIDLSPVQMDNRRCLNCHGQRHIGEIAGAERRGMLDQASQASPVRQEQARPALFIAPEELSGVHADVRCVSCHSRAAQLPHAADLGPVDCNAACHRDAGAAYRRGAHAQAAARGIPDAPGCVSCHGGHRVFPKKDLRSRAHPLQVVRLCGDCHERHTAPTPNGLQPGAMVANYLESVHGRAVTRSGLIVAATCNDCHGSHDVLPASHPDSTVHRANVPETCGQCHLGVEETYARSIHGQLLAKGSEEAPVCSDCHTAHAVTRTGTSRFMLDVISECGQCHDTPSKATGKSLYDLYRQSYHGQVTKLGSTRAARCSDCHGAHDILPIKDPNSRLHVEHRIETCRRCHPGADAKFAQFIAHADYRDKERFPLLHAVWVYFVIMMSAAFGFFGLHSLLWFGRALAHRWRHGPPAHRHGGNPHGIQRFNKLDRINHLLVVISFFGLTLTGMPLFFAEQRWAQALALMLGGVQAAGILHRIFAIVLAINFALHGYSIYQRWMSGPHTSLRQRLLGPNTMLPRWKDVTDALGMFRWFFGLGPKPRFDRWTYWEKFDYWAEIGGSAIIGGSGLLLWFPVFFSRFVPGWTFNVATIIHGYEALLAVGFIFTIHFFNAHLRPEKFPVDDVIFTGQLPEEEFQHERGEEYDRAVQEGTLHAMRVAPAPPWQRRGAVVVGIVAMTIGASLVVLIVLAGLNLIH